MFCTYTQLLQWNSDWKWDVFFRFKNHFCGLVLNKKALKTERCFTFYTRCIHKSLLGSGTWDTCRCTWWWQYWGVWTLAVVASSIRVNESSERIHKIETLHARNGAHRWRQPKALLTWKSWTTRDQLFRCRHLSSLSHNCCVSLGSEPLVLHRFFSTRETSECIYLSCQSDSLFLFEVECKSKKKEKKKKKRKSLKRETLKRKKSRNVVCDGGPD